MAPYLLAFKSEFSTTVSRNNKYLDWYRGICDNLGSDQDRGEAAATISLGGLGSLTHCPAYSILITRMMADNGTSLKIKITL